MTAGRVVTTRRADEDIDGAVTRYLGEAGPPVAIAFIDDLQHALSRLTAYPSLGSARFELVTEIPDIRAFPLRNHPYLVIYTDDPDAVRVHRVLHTRRDIAAALTESDRDTAWSRLVRTGRVTLPTKKGALSHPPQRQDETSAQILDAIRADRI
ncbi:type II toxin-antitoxin system RelE/ParE family toxin [Microbacterium sp. AGC62]|uniref:type II toxin-antitoxin system RelE/ParE family toxin n=1 Tax=Microbacterium TaxID=33882 RepID=UPI0009DEAE56|nr:MULTISPECIES: type II toxin-antitoxin system RelE/ParE family toxin [unclassified Microbacterium]PRB58981.1 type II toxin-antitoxin system RelE/ParE family toxin [Microbacterium sp. MYb45]